MKRTIVFFKRVKLPVLLSLLIVLLLPHNAQAQPAYVYTEASSSGVAFTPIPGATTLPGLAFDDATVTDIPLGFAFTFCGNSYTKVSACSNGWVSFSNTSSVAYSNTNAAALSSFVPGGVLMPFWDDLSGADSVGTGPAPTVSYKTIGTAGNLIFIIEYDNFRWDYTSGNGVVNFQVRLLQNGNKIQYVYGTPTNPLSNSSANFGATIGIANSTYDFLTLNNSGSSPTASLAPFTNNIITTPASGQMYEFRPPANCTGTPTAGTVSASPNVATTCIGSTINYSLTGYSTTSNIQITWQDSVVGGVWTAIPTTGNYPTVSLFVTQTVWVRAMVTCTTSGISSFSNVLNVAAQVPNYATLPFLESFESWSNACNTTDAPSSGNWLNIPNTGSNSWRRDDQGASASWTNPGSGSYTPAAVLGSHSARFHTAGTTINQKGTLDLYVDLSAANPKGLIYSYYNADGTDTLRVLLSTDAGANFTTLDSLGATGGTWTKKSLTIPSSGPSAAQCVIRFLATSDGGTSDIGLDSVYVKVLPVCSSPVEAGTITSNVSPPVCQNVSFNLSDFGYTLASGVSLQWQTSLSGQNNWSNIVGATSPSYTVLSQYLASDYRLIATCSLSGATDSTNVFSVSQTPAINCYCTPAYTVGCANDYISNVTLGSINNTTACSPGSVITYSAPNPTFIIGQSYSGSVTTNSTVAGDDASIWIDFDRNNNLASPANNLVLNNAVPTPAGTLNNTYPFSFTVPANANPGLTLMRVRSQKHGGTTLTPCSSNANGEDEDYYVTIAPAAPVVSFTNSPVCLGNTIVLVATTPVGNHSMNWTGPVGGQVPAGGTTGDTLRIFNATAADAGTYSVTVLSNGVMSTASTTVVSLNPSPIFDSVKSMSPLCAGNNLCFTIYLNPLSPAVTSYTWTDPTNSSFSSISNPCINSVTSANTGRYIVAAQTALGCISRDTLFDTVTNIPVIGGVTTTDPTACGASDGKLTLTGLTPNTHYDSLYFDSSAVAHPVSGGFTTDASGNFIILHLGAGTYDHVSVSNHGCTSPVLGPYTLNAPGSPGTPLLNTNSAVCAGGILKITASTIPGATYAWSGPGITPGNHPNDTAQNPIINPVAVTDSGTYSLTITVSGCSSATPTTVTATVYPAPVISFASSSNPTTCTTPHDGKIILNTNLPGTVPCQVTYTKNGGSPSILTFSSVSGTLTMTGLDSGTYTNFIVKVNGGLNNNGCISNTITGPYHLSYPASPTITGPTLYGGCFGTTINISDTAHTLLPGPITYTWSTSLPASTITGTSTQSPTIASLSASDTGIYHLVATAAGCASNPYNVHVVGGTPPAKPNANATPTVICSGGFITFTASAVSGSGITYQWSGPADNPPAKGWNGSSAQQNTQILSPNVFNTGTYFVVAKQNGCPSQPGSVVVSVNKSDTINAITFTNPTFCGSATASIQLCGTMAANGSGYTITYTRNNIVQPQLTNQSTDASGCFNLLNLPGGSYTNIIVNNGGCLANFQPAQGTILLSDPTAPTVTAPTPAPICEGDSLNLNSVPSGGTAPYTFKWTSTSGYTSTSQNPTIYNALSTLSGSDSIVVKDANGCSSQAFVIPIVVNQTPVVPTITYSNSPVCAGTCLTLVANTVTAGNVNYAWAGPAGPVGPSANDSAIYCNISGAGAGIYTVTASIGLCHSQTTTTVAVVTPPHITVLSQTPSTICQGNGTVTLTGLISGQLYDVVYTITGGSPQTITGLTANASGQIVIPNIGFGSAATYSIYVISQATQCRSNSVNVTVFGPAVPTISGSVAHSALPCNGGADSVSITTNLGSFIASPVYHWTVPVAGHAHINGDTVSSFINFNFANSPDSGLYIVTVTDTNTGCTSLPDTFKVFIFPVPAVPTVTASTVTVCEQGTINLGAATTAVGALYSWSGPCIAPGTYPNDTAQNPTINNATLACAGVYTVSITVNGCKSASDSVTVIVNPLPAAPVLNYNNGNGPVCAGDFLQLNDTSSVAGVTVHWNGPSSAVNATILPDTNTHNPHIAHASAADSGVYNVYTTFNGCNSAPSQVTVIVNPVPATPVATCTPSAICAGQSINLHASNVSGPGIQYHWSGTGILPPVGNTIIDPNDTLKNPIILNAPVGFSGYYFVNVTQNGCTSLNGTTLVVVYPIPPTPTPTNNGPVCVGTPVQFSLPATPGATNYNWSGPIPAATNALSPSASAQQPSIANTLLTYAGTYSVTTTVNGCTSAPGTTTLQVQAIPATPASVTNNGPICLGSDIVLNSATVVPAAPASSVSYVWTGTGPAGYTTTTTSTHDTIPGSLITAAGTYTYTVKSTVLPGCTSVGAAQTIVTVKPIPAAPVATSNTPLCTGVGTTTLNLFASTVTGASGYTWSGPTPAVTGTILPNANTQNPHINNITVADGGTYSVIATVNGCPSLPATTTVLVTQSPAAPVVSNPNLVFCQFDVIPNLSTYVNASNLLWYTTATGGVGQPSFTPSTLVPGFFVRYISQTVNGCEGPRSIMTVTINPKPTAPVPTQATYTYCQGDVPTQLSVVGSPNILWYTLPAGGNGSTIPPVPSTATPGIVTYYVSQIVNGCESDRASITVVVNPTPPSPTVTTPIRYCTGDVPAPLIATVGAAGDVLHWYTTLTGGVGSTTVPTPTTTAAGTQSWWVDETSQFGCISKPRQEIDVNVLLTPTNGIVSNYPNYICQHDTVTFAYVGNGDPTFQYTWTVPFGGTLISGSGMGPIQVRFDNVDTSYVYLIVHNGQCVSPLDSQIVRIRYKPVITMSTKKDVCIDQTLNVELSSSSTNIQNYVWDFAGGDTIYEQQPAGPFGLAWHNTDYGQHIVKVYTQYNGCNSNLILDTIQVHRLPDATIVASNITSICPGDSILLQAHSVNPGYTYTWLPTQFFDANNQPQVYGKGEFTGFVSLTVTDPWGCSSTETTPMTTLNSCCVLHFPNAFTPNNDGINDVFHSLAGGHHDISVFRIQNRWGQTVFETNNENFGWDGTYNGVAQDIGTYYYFVRYQCNEGPVLEEKGELLLVR
ncbi:MAG: gliding motility-associated C-terminal domain-containing protein [Bacteroidota bacterium]